jgi:hypothetical protein
MAKVVICWRFKADAVDLEAVYGEGPWWLCLWFRICQFFDGHYWRAYNRLYPED